MNLLSLRFLIENIFISLSVETRERVQGEEKKFSWKLIIFSVCERNKKTQVENGIGSFVWAEEERRRDI